MLQKVRANSNMEVATETQTPVFCSQKIPGDVNSKTLNISNVNSEINGNVDLSSAFKINDTSYDPIKQDDPLWMILMDRSQLIMTIIGLLANVGTSVTLMKNKQVRVVRLSRKILILYLHLLRNAHIIMNEVLGR